MIDRLCYQSKLRYMNASVKCLYAVLTLVFCIAARSFPAAAVVFAVNWILTVWKGGIPLSSYIRLLLVPAAFLIVGTAVLIVNISDVPMNAFAVQIGSRYLTGSRESVTEALRVGAAAMASVSCLYFLALSTTMTDIISTLRKIHCPALLTELMLLIYRFIFLLMGTAGSLMRAQEARLGNKDLRTGMRSFGMMGSALFLQALKRANALYDAMESRCYDGEIRVLSGERPPKKKEIILLAVFEILLLGIAIWSRGM